MEEFSEMCEFLILFDSVKKRLDVLEDTKGKQCLTPRSLRKKLRSGEIRIMKYSGNSSGKPLEEIQKEKNEINVCRI